MEELGREGNGFGTRRLDVYIRYKNRMYESRGKSKVAKALLPTNGFVELFLEGKNVKTSQVNLCKVH